MDGCKVITQLDVERLRLLRLVQHIDGVGVVRFLDGADMEIGILSQCADTERDVTRTHRAREVTEGVVVGREVDNIVGVIDHHLCAAMVEHVRRTANGVEHAVPIDIAGHPVVDAVDDILRIAVYSRVLGMPLRPPRRGVCPVRGILAPPESVVAKPPRLLIACVVRYTRPARTTEVVDAAFGVHQDLVGIECVERVKDLRKTGDRRAVPMQRRTGCIVARLGIAVIDSCGVTVCLEGILVKAEDLDVRELLSQDWSKMLGDERSFRLGREIHAFPRTVIAHRFVLGRNSPELYPSLAVGLQVTGEVARERVVIFRQQRSATAVLTVKEQVVVLHPRRCRPRRTHEPPGGIGLRGFEGCDLGNELIHIEVLVLDLRVLVTTPAILMHSEGEMLQGFVTGDIVVGVMTLEGKVTRTDDRTCGGEVRTILAEQFADNHRALFGCEARKHKR